MAKTDNILKVADYRIDSFESGVEGVDPITPAGTPVAKSKEAQVVEAAKKAGVELVNAADVETDAEPDQASANNAPGSGSGSNTGGGANLTA